MRIVITGAAGRIGRELVDEFSGLHELCLLDCKPVTGHKSIIADLTEYLPNPRYKLWSWLKPRRWWNELGGAEVVIHLAEDPNPNANWQRVLHNNIQATWNVLQAAVQHHVRRFVYASSCWTVKGLEMELGSACYNTNGPKIDSETAPRPLTPYGIAKACGETTGRMLVDEKKLGSFVALRLGLYSPNCTKNDKDDRSWSIGTHDLRCLFRRCVEADFEGFHIVYGVSAQKITPCDLSHTRSLLSWEPSQLPE